MLVGDANELIDRRLLEGVTDRDGLVKLLGEAEARGGLGWPVDAEQAFVGEPEIAEGVKGGRVNVFRLVPPSGDSKFLVLLAEFEEAYVRRDLRELLRSLRKYIRETAKYSDYSGFEDTVFIVASPGYDDVRFVLFEEQDERQPRIRSFYWSRSFVGRTVLNVNLPALTWASRAAWSEAWSTLAVTNEFFDAYEKYFKFWCPQIEIKTHDGRQLALADLIEIRTHLMQRSMNRLLFLTFLSKKRWLEFKGQRENYLTCLYESWKASPRGEGFYVERLSKLFFEGLADERDSVRIALEPAIGRVPYLNGGLFERKHFERTEAHEDKVIFPDGMFEGLLGTGGLLNSYNFTVVESLDECDQDIAVDPEMLGRIFEKLVLDRRDEGKYYTPRIVVRFMCRESLKRVLGDEFEAIIEAPNLDAKRSEAAKLDGGTLRRGLALLNGIKIVDPACGSGAYLLGMLHELFELVMAIELRLNQRKEAEKYQLKLEIIERNLYGVDLDEFATSIAMLRLWLSLVVDRNENPLDEVGVDVSLPNLRFKICNGDSLTAPNPRSSLFTGDEFIADSQMLRSLHDEYFLPDAHRARPKAEVLAEVARCESRLALNFEGESIPSNAFDWRVRFAEVFAPRGKHEPFEGFDIVLANPPYGVRVGDEVRLAYFDRQSEGSQSKDSYGIFLARATQLLKPGGVLCFIVSDTWRTIKSHLPLRKMLISRTTVQHFIDLPSWIFDATVNTGIVTIVNEEPGPEHRLIAADLRAIPNGDWRTLEGNLSSISYHGPDVQTLAYARYSYLQSFISSYKNYSFFIASPRVYALMSDSRFSRLMDVADVRTGLQTGDNDYYLRKRPGIRGNYQILDEELLLSDSEIASLTEDEKLNGVDPTHYGGRRFVPYDKGGEGDAEGGWLPCYYVPTGYFIDWSRSSVHRMKTMTSNKQGGTVGSRFQNSQFYFVPGLTWSDAGFYSPTVRLSGLGVFDVKGSRMIVKDGRDELILGYLCSKLAKYFIKTICNHTVSTQVDDIRELRLPIELPTEANRIPTLVAQIVQKQKQDPRYPYHLHEQNEIDQLVYDIFEFEDQDVREVELWFCRRYRGLAVAQGLVDDAKTRYQKHLAWCEFIFSKPPGYWRLHPIVRLIASDEGASLEFKETLEFVDRIPASVPENKREEWKANKQRERVEGVLKTICAFLNSNGGTLIIGVSDGKQIVGIGPDLSMLGKKKNRDGFELKLNSLLKEHISPLPSGIVTEFHDLQGKEICQITVSSSRRPYYFDNKLYVRFGNSTEELSGLDLQIWLQERLG